MQGGSMNKLIVARVTDRYLTAVESDPMKQAALKVLQKVEKFLVAYKKATDKYSAAVQKADSPEPGYVVATQMDSFWDPLKKFSSVARDLGQGNLEDLYYDTEGSLNERARNTYDVLKYQLMLLFSDGSPPSLGSAWKGAKSLSDGTRHVAAPVASMNNWFKATQKWLNDTNKALTTAKKETNKARNWKK